MTSHALLGTQATRIRASGNFVPPSLEKRLISACGTFNKSRIMRSKFLNSLRVCICIPLCHVSDEQKHVCDIVLPFANVKPLHVVLFTKPNLFLQFRVVFFEVTKPIFAISL